MALDKRETKQRWFIKSRNCYSNNSTELKKRLFNVCKKNQLRIKSLGQIAKEHIYLISAPKRNKSNQNVLIIGGIHGDEPAGCWGILSYLENVKFDLFNRVNIYIIPTFNPTGFRLGNMNNIFEEYTNGGYYQNSKKRNLSREGKIITRAKLEKINFSALLTLHEDYDQKKFYVYCWEESSEPKKFSKYMSDSSRGIFEKYTGIADGFKVKRGLIFNLQNYEILKPDEIDSLEFDFFRKGVKEVVASEVPRISDINKRILACQSIIENFIKYYS